MYHLWFQASTGGFRKYPLADEWGLLENMEAVHKL